MISWELPEYQQDIIGVEALGHNITYIYAGPCLYEIPQGREISIDDGGVRNFSIEGLEEHSNYTVTVTTFYPSDKVSTSMIITTLPGG